MALLLCLPGQTLAAAWRYRLLDLVDPQIAEALSYRMRSQGVTFRLGEEVEEVTKSSEGKACAKQ